MISSFLGDFVWRDSCETCWDNSLLFLPCSGYAGDGVVGQVYQGGEAAGEEDVDGHGQQIVVLGNHHAQDVSRDF